ncbi:hypothetical protein IFM89_038782 [Coptis chinensis]|uniref:Uncharacterized protein n=1 Tax=Coptis chinensis TaxID=261450 RepID=A0A835J2E3_9MAGN|nr:hypothetical protein IFM89_038782 [Coptis chinensis]
MSSDAFNLAKDELLRVKQKFLSILQPERGSGENEENNAESNIMQAIHVGETVDMPSTEPYHQIGRLNSIHQMGHTSSHLAGNNQSPSETDGTYSSATYVQPIFDKNLGMWFVDATKSMGSTDGDAFVKGQVTYTVKYELVIMPMLTISTITLLNV